MSITGSRVLIALLLLAAVCGVAVGVSSHGGPMGVDTTLATWLGAHHGESVAVVSSISDFFGPAAVSVLTVIAALVFLVRDRGIRRAVTLMAIVAVAGVITEVTKMLVARPRPPMWMHPSIPEMTNSFPSGHVTGTAAFFFGVALLATSRRVSRIAASAAAAVITVFVAWTRLYLGVHWFSDVCAAAAVGVAATLVAPLLADLALGVLHRVVAARRTVDSRVVERT